MESEMCGEPIGNEPPDRGVYPKGEGWGGGLEEWIESEKPTGEEPVTICLPAEGNLDTLFVTSIKAVASMHSVFIYPNPGKEKMVVESVAGGILRLYNLEGVAVTPREIVLGHIH